MDSIWPAASTAEFYIVTGAAIELLNHLSSSTHTADKRKHPGQNKPPNEWWLLNSGQTHNIAPTQSLNETIDWSR